MLSQRSSVNEYTLRFIHVQLCTGLGSWEGTKQTGGASKRQEGTWIYVHYLDCGGGDQNLPSYTLNMGGLL